LPLYDAVARHEAIEKLVVREVGDAQERKYWRFRAGRWYGGIVTADAVGCGLICKYCWVSDKVMFKPATVGKFYTAKDAVKNLMSIAEKQGLRQLRVSGGEPTIGKQHLLELLNSLRGKGCMFILETNGILIGNDPEYAKALSGYPFLHVRVSLKGCNEKEFATLTDAKPEGFNLQLKALENLISAHIECHPAVMTSFSPKESIRELNKRLKAINPQLSRDLEIEELILYPSVEKRIEKHGLNYYTAYTPEKVPTEQI
jgi:uncharacterized Fe-S cluster-containing radical SAM superfamily protein